MSTSVLTSPNLQIAGAPYPKSDFIHLWGGLNDAMSDELIQPNQLAEVENWIPDRSQSGHLIKREGMTSDFSLTSEPVFAIFDGQKADYISVHTKIYDSGGTARDTGLTSIATYSAETWSAPSWISFGAYDIVAHGGNEIRKTSDGTSFSALSNIPAGVKYLVSYHQFVFAAGHSGGTVRWSETGDPESWPTSNFWILESRGKAVKGMTSYADMVLVFFEDSFYCLRGFGEQSISIVHDNRQEGTTSNKSIVPCEFGVFWWGKSGIYHSPDGFQARNISRYRVPNLLEGRNKAYDHVVHGVYNPDEQRVEWWYCNGTSTTHNAKVYYYPQEDAFYWGTGTGVQMSGSGVLRESSVNNVYVGTPSLPSGGGVYKQSGADDNGVPIVATLVTRRDAPVHTRSVKRMRSWTLSVYRDIAGSVTVGAYWDNSNNINQTWDVDIPASGAFILGTSTLGTGTLGGTPFLVDEFEVGVRRKFRKARFRVTDQNMHRTRLLGLSHEGYILNA